MTLQASVSTPTGPETGWFWSFDCAEACDHPVAGADLGFTYGVAAGLAGRPVALGLGVNGTHPYVDGYVQLGKGARLYGLGARVGLPIMGWLEHQLYGRYDLRVGETTRLLLNPALFVHHGRAPNGERPTAVRRTAYGASWRGAGRGGARAAGGVGVRNAVGASAVRT